FDIECRNLEAKGRARATVARRLCTIAGLYRYAEEEGLIDHSPAVHVRRPRLDYESHATGLDRNELGALLVAAGLSSARDHALISLLALNGLRISEALGADIEALGLERRHRTLTVTRKGGKVVTPAGAAHRPGRQPGHRRADGRPHLPRGGRGPPGPSRRRSDRPPSRPPGWDHEAGRTAHSASRLHDRRPRRRRAPPRRPRGCIPRRPQNHDALRARTGITRPARQPTSWPRSSPAPPLNIQPVFGRGHQGPPEGRTSICAPS